MIILFNTEMVESSRVLPPGGSTAGWFFCAGSGPQNSSRFWGELIPGVAECFGNFSSAGLYHVAIDCPVCCCCTFGGCYVAMQYGSMAT